MFCLPGNPISSDQQAHPHPHKALYETHIQELYLNFKQYSHALATLLGSFGEKSVRSSVGMLQGVHW